ncbi:HK97 family phage prohead protease [Rhizobium herbae]|uniref:HK97 family phage prohead protease n=1 Tax=Rhizobium herbae TaxID=508661 RepID=A0ABS4EFY4_9HYPH|nr:HK97 family phage prohead protease [Rhizobium herbae]MBP1856853.1 HK97 family phage prohead protease [Rhizobium herbae]
MDRIFFETKVLTDDAGAISGIAWKYDQADRVGDMIAPGAFSKAAFPIPMLAFHDMGDPIGTWDTAEDKGGAWHIKGKLLVDEVSRAREVRALVRSGAIKGLSVGFITGKAESRPGGRLIKSLELLEVSLVTIGMHPGATVTSAKSAVTALNIAAALNRAAAHFAAR